jgi:endonuclease/exonuclease/phosphatase (EEP) superfamily protein YafD
MAAQDTSGAQAFWRCERCGTPNPWAKYLTQCVGCGADRPAKRDSRAAEVPTTARFAVGKLGIASIAYLVFLLLCWGSIRTFGDDWWFATLLLFSPRWLFLLPVVAFGILSWRKPNRVVWLTQAVCAILILGPLMGLHFPWRRWTTAPAEGPRVRVMTINLGLQHLSVPELTKAIESQRIDIVCMQEWPENPQLVNRELDRYFSRGWYRTKKQTIASRFPIVEEYPASSNDYEEYWFWPARLERARVQLSSGQSFVVASAHLPTMRNGFWFLSKGDFAASRRYLGWRATQLVEVLGKLTDTGDFPILMGGDFNTPADSPRMAIPKSSYQSAFDDAGLGFGYTYPARLPWARIDQIFGSSDWQFTACWLGPNVGSDHLPVVAEAILKARPMAPAPDRPATVHE